MTTTVLTKIGWYNKIMHGIGNDSTAADTTDSYEIQAKKGKKTICTSPHEKMARIFVNCVSAQVGNPENQK
jgi:hypothetical protein